MGTLKLHLVFLLVIASLGTGLKCQAGGLPQNTVKDFFAAVGNSDYEKSTTFCTGKMAEGYILGETLQTWCNQVENKRIHSRILNVDTQQRTATVVFELDIFGEGDQMKAQKLIANLVKREGKWLIDDINVP